MPIEGQYTPAQMAYQLSWEILISGEDNILSLCGIDRISSAIIDIHKPGMGIKVKVTGTFIGLNKVFDYEKKVLSDYLKKYSSNYLAFKIKGEIYEDYVLNPIFVSGKLVGFKIMNKEKYNEILRRRYK